MKPLFCRDPRSKNDVLPALPALLFASMSIAGAGSAVVDPWKGDLKYAARPEHVKSAHCARQEPFTLDEILAWIEQAGKNDRKVTRTIHGITLRNESEKAAQWLEALLTAGARPNYPTPAQKNFSAPGCETAVCAARAIFGEKVGPQLLMMIGRYGRNGSLHAHEPADLWTAEELDSVLLMLSDFPESVLPNRVTNGSFVRYPRAKGTNNDWRGGGSVIADPWGVYDLWSKLPPEHRRSFALHELAHQFSTIRDWNNPGRDTIVYLPSWKGFSGGWKKGFSSIDSGEIIEDASNDPSKIVSLYGRISPMEDFAESVVAYRYNPAALKAVSPQKYDFVRETVFDGVEYTSAEACASPKLISARTNELIASRLAPATLSEKEFITPTLQACSPTLVPALLRKHASKIALDCVTAELKRRGMPPIEQLGLRYPEEASYALAVRTLQDTVPEASVNRVADEAFVRLREFMVRFAWGRIQEVPGGNFLSNDDYCSERIVMTESWREELMKVFSDGLGRSNSLHIAAVPDLQATVRKLCTEEFGKRQRLSRKITEASVRASIENYFR